MGTLRQASITTASTLANAVLGAGFYFLLARYLGPAGYGQFTLAITLIPLLSGILDLGTSEALVKFVPSRRANSAYFPAAKLALTVKLISGITTVIFLSLLAQPISISLFRQPSLAAAIPWVGVGVLGQLLFSFSTYLFQALEKFYLWGGLFVSTNLVRLILLLLLVSLGLLSSSSALFIHISMPILGFVLSWVFLDRRIWSTHFDGQTLARFLAFNKWITATTVISAVISRLDIILTGRLLSLSLTGTYALSTQLVVFFPQLVTAISAVTTPKFASFQTIGDNRRYLKKTVWLTLGAGFLTALGLIPASLVVIRFAGPGYLASFLPFLILLSAHLIFLAATPFQDSLVYFSGRPQILFWLNLLSAPVIILSSLWLIPWLGPVGSSLSVLLHTSATSLTSIIYWFKFTNDRA